MTNLSAIACDVGHLARRFPSHGGCVQRERREWLCRHLNAETAQGPRCGSPTSGRPCLRPTALMRRGFPVERHHIRYASLGTWAREASRCEAFSQRCPAESEFPQSGALPMMVTVQAG
jgi:hypothetical protein